MLLIVNQDSIAKKNSSASDTELIECLESLVSIGRILKVQQKSINRMLREVSNDKVFLTVVVPLVLAKVKHPAVNIHLDLQITVFRIKIGLREEEVLLDTENSKSS